MNIFEFCFRAVQSMHSIFIQIQFLKLNRNFVSFLHSLGCTDNQNINSHLKNHSNFGQLGESVQKQGKSLHLLFCIHTSNMVYHVIPSSSLFLFKLKTKQNQKYYVQMPVSVYQVDIFQSPVKTNSFKLTSKKRRGSRKQMLGLPVYLSAP